MTAARRLEVARERAKADSNAHLLPTFVQKLPAIMRTAFKFPTLRIYSGALETLFQETPLTPVSAPDDVDEAAGRGAAAALARRRGRQSPSDARAARPAGTNPRR